MMISQYFTCHALCLLCSPHCDPRLWIGRAGPSILSSVAPHAPLRKELWLAINKIIHDDDIPVGRSQNAIARRNSDEKNASCVKPDSQERKASAIGWSGQHVLAKQQVTVDIEVFDLRAMISIHVGEYGAEPCARCRMRSSRYEEKCFRDVAIQGAEEPLGLNVLKSAG